METQYPMTKKVTIGELFGEAFTLRPDMKMLPWKDSFHEGGTGYIDGIKPEDMTVDGRHHSVMFGVCPKGRKFIAFRYRVVERDKEVKEVVETVFQRYSMDDIVTSGGQSYLVQSQLCEGNMHQIRELLKGNNTYLGFTDLIGIPRSEDPNDCVVLHSRPGNWGDVVTGYTKRVELELVC